LSSERIKAIPSVVKTELISDRELQELKLIEIRKTVFEIADELSLSVATISTYSCRLLKKMDMKNNSKLTLSAINNFLIQIIPSFLSLLQ